MAKRFFYTAAGLLALSAAYHLGAVRTGAQGGDPFVGLTYYDPCNELYAITASGSVWRATGCPGPLSDPTYVGSFSGGPTPTESRSFGSVKDMFRR